MHSHFPKNGSFRDCWAKQLEREARRRDVSRAVPMLENAKVVSWLSRRALQQAVSCCGYEPGTLGGHCYRTWDARPVSSTVDIQ
jgi:hypothetical protein